MSGSTSLKISFFSKEKELIKKIDLDARADEFIYDLLNDGGSTYNPDILGEFDDSEKEIMKVYFDQESMSVSEGYATVTQNIQDPKELKMIWTKIRSTLINGFQQKMVSYHNDLTRDINLIKEVIKDHNEIIEKQSLFSKIKKVELPNITPLMTVYNFERAISDNIWSIDCLSQVLVLLDMADKEKMLVEITVTDD